MRYQWIEIKSLIRAIKFSLRVKMYMQKCEKRNSPVDSNIGFVDASNVKYKVISLLRDIFTKALWRFISVTSNHAMAREIGKSHVLDPAGFKSDVNVDIMWHYVPTR